MCFLVRQILYSDVEHIKAGQGPFKILITGTLEYICVLGAGWFGLPMKSQTLLVR